MLKQKRYDDWDTLKTLEDATVDSLTVDTEHRKKFKAVIKLLS